MLTDCNSLVTVCASKTSPKPSPLDRMQPVMERSHPTSGRSATPADINRNGRPTSIGTSGRHQSECPADIIGMRNRPAQTVGFIASVTWLGGLHHSDDIIGRHTGTALGFLSTEVTPGRNGLVIIWRFMMGLFTEIRLPCWRRTTPGWIRF